MLVAEGNTQESAKSTQTVLAGPFKFEKYIFETARRNRRGLLGEWAFAIIPPFSTQNHVLREERNVGRYIASSSLISESSSSYIVFLSWQSCVTCVRWVFRSNVLSLSFDPRRVCACPRERERERQAGSWRGIEWESEGEKATHSYAATRLHQSRTDREAKTSAPGSRAELPRSPVASSGSTPAPSLLLLWVWEWKNGAG